MACFDIGWFLLQSSFVSFVIVLLSHSALIMVPRLFPFLSFIVMLPIAGFVLISTYALAGWLRRILGIVASAPAMVICHILFLWAVHITIIREVVPNLMDVSLNMECLSLLFGLYRIFSCDPGLVSFESTYCGGVVGPEPVSVDSSYSGTHGQTDALEFNRPDKSSLLFSRVRFCSCCKRSVEGFDHHCPAFGNCIGQKNHHLFMLLVIFFIITEGTYTFCSSQYIKLSSGARVKFEGIFPCNLVTSTLLFSFLQVLWQVPFLGWHIYCICCNIRTDEWINWRKYPEFQIVAQPQEASRFTVTRFVNPYNNGIMRNIREYLAPSSYSKHFIV